MSERVRKVTPRKIVTLLGSTRFKKEFLEVAASEGLKGHVVLTVNWFSHADGSMGEEAELKFQQMHFDKIDMSDECVVVNPAGYVGDQTGKEIAYCEEHGIPVRYVYDRITSRKN